jgi:DNA-binding NarL/FixJ family response regulator
MIRVLIADPDASTRRALALWLTYRFGIDPIQQLADGNCLEESLSVSVPDLILMDWSIPHRPRGEFYERLVAENPLLRWIILSVDPDVSAQACFPNMTFFAKSSSLDALDAQVEQVLKLNHQVS